MGIAALPPSTVRILGSAQVLTTPVSLVKELVDNALDAKATSVDVTISSDTLDKIEVRDNGHGIAQEDLDALGRRGHTSKLRSFDELRFIGCTSLGFRGEALASATELGQVDVTTRTEGEAIATTIKLQVQGGVAKRKPISHPVGTTVLVSKFLDQLAVRKQTAVKESPKTLSKIKDLLRSYALARPTVRFTLKVVKGGKGPVVRGKNDFVFAPRAHDGVKEAVSQVIGREVTAECVEVRTSDGNNEEPLGSGATDEKRDFHIEAFLPKGDADLLKVLGKGQYISVDSRPVSSTRGTLKRISTLFKEYIKTAALAAGKSEVQIKDPFLRLNIVCRPGSYDPNVEPAKDNVLFEDENALLRCAEQLFVGVYGDLSAKKAAYKQPTQKENGFDLLMARKPAPARPKELVSNRDIHTPDEKGVHGVHRKTKWDFSMATDFDEPEDTTAHRESSMFIPQDKPSIPQQHKELELKSSKSSGDELNPWLIAKLNASLQATPAESMPSTLQHDERSNNHSVLLPSPRHSSEGPGLPHIPSNTRSQNRDFVEASYLPLGRAWSPPSSFEPGPKRQRQHGKTSSIPVRNTSSRSVSEHSGDLLQFPSDAQDHDQQNDQKDVYKLQNPLVAKARDNNHGHFVQQTLLHQHVDDALEFERRKEAATQRRRAEIRAASQENPYGPSQSSPHQNRYNAAVAVLESSRGSNEQESAIEKIPLKTTIPDGDPRAYLMRRQKSMSDYLETAGPRTKLKRTKSTLLPLETVPETQMMHNIEVNTQLDMKTLERRMRNLHELDRYIVDGTLEKALPIEEEVVVEMKQRLISVVKAFMRHRVGDKHESEADMFLSRTDLALS
jgi:DNA mismatch repair protein MutL